MAEKTDRIDRAAICLAEWIERAGGYRNSDVWAEWHKNTQEALKAHNQERAQLAELVRMAKMALFDHNLVLVAARLNKLGELLR